MFNNKPAAPVTEPVEVGTAVPTDLIPLSVLQLDLPAPGSGWDAYLTGRGISIVLDHIGRKAVSSADARQLFDEQREVEARRREMAAEAERQAVEADRVRRASIWGGVSALDLPPDVRPAAAMLQAARDAQPKRRTPLEDAFAGEGIVFHPIQGEEAS
jgi:hypothetical protein